MRQLALFRFLRGYASTVPEFDNEMDYMAKGSENALAVGQGKIQAYKGPAIVNGVNGGKQMYVVGEGYASLGDFGTSGLGNVFRVLSALFFIGTGLLRFNGLSLSTNASSTLSLLIRRGGGYTGSAQNGPFQAGLAQPPAPTVWAKTPGAGFSGKCTGTFAAVVWRIRSSTGATSIKSVASPVVVAENQTLAIKFESADSNGQDRWGIGVPLAGFGATGPFYEYTEIAESYLGENTTRNDVATNSASLNIYSKQTLTITVVGTITTAGNATVVVTAAGMTGSPKTVNVAVLLGDTASVVAGKIKTALEADANISAYFDFSLVGATLTATRKAAVAFDATMLITIANGTCAGLTSASSAVLSFFTTSHIGWEVVLSGGTPACVLTSYVTAVPAVNTLTLADMPPATSTGVSAVVTRAVDGVKRAVEIEFRDGDLAGASLAPTRSFPPPAAVFGGTIQDVTFVDGAWGDVTDGVSAASPGTAIVPSEPLFGEAFPPDNAIFTNSTPTALIRGGDNLYWRFSANSLGAITYKGGQPALSYQTIWENTGILSPHNAVIAKGSRLYCITGKRGLVRIGVDGEPDSSFSARVADDFANVDPRNVVLGWDSDHQFVCYMYMKTIWAFNVQDEIWCAPSNLNGLITGNICAAVTIDNTLHIATNDGSTIRLYKYNAGTGTVIKVATPWKHAENENDSVSILHVSMRADNTANQVSVKVYGFGDDGAVLSSMDITLARTGLQTLPTLKPNVAGLRSHKIVVSHQSTGGDSGFEFIKSFGEESGIPV